MPVKSPFAEKEEAIYEKEIPVSEIVGVYKDQLSIEIRQYFSDINTIQIYRCPITGYRFYVPSVTAGEELYIMLKTFDWYYREWKWEYEKSLEYFDPVGKVVLEVGCGTGAFLKKIAPRCKQATGIDLSVKSENVDNVSIFKETIETHSVKNKGLYDVVFAFQVLEHVYDVKSFLSSVKEVLKPGGLFIVGVPDNGTTLMKEDNRNALNMPPHHVGLWEKDPLKKAGSLIGLDYIIHANEPLQKEQAKNLYNLRMRILIKRHPLIGKTIDKIFWRSGYRFFLLFKNKIKGHSMLMVFKNNA